MFEWLRRRRDAKRYARWYASLIQEHAEVAGRLNWVTDRARQLLVAQNDASTAWAQLTGELLPEGTTDPTQVFLAQMVAAAAIRIVLGNA